jgi:hypothetical protein
VGAGSPGSAGCACGRNVGILSGEPLAALYRALLCNRTVAAYPRLSLRWSRTVCESSRSAGVARVSKGLLKLKKPISYDL